MQENWKRRPTRPDPSGWGFLPFVTLLLCAFTLTAADPLADSARRKMNLIEDMKAKRGSVISFSPQEITAWAKDELPESGFTSPVIKLGPAKVEIEGNIDVAKLAQSRAKEMNPLLARLLEGERPVKAALEINSGQGKATINVTTLELSGVPVSGLILDYLLQLVMTKYPTVRLNEPMDLKYNMERVDFRATGVRVTIKK